MNQYLFEVCMFAIGFMVGVGAGRVGWIQAECPAPALCEAPDSVRLVRYDGVVSCADGQVAESLRLDEASIVIRCHCPTEGM